MPEYLTPGVYIEEIELGAKPIEGVSTSTAGFVGMAEKGPLNKPNLVTSFAEYQRIFGGYLGKDYNDKRFLPYAVEGFFSNGGRRAYVTRVAKDAKRAKGFIPNITGLKTKVTIDAAAGSKTLEIADVTGLKENDVLLLKGDHEEILTYRGPAKFLKIDGKLNQAIKEGEEVKKMNKDTATTYTLKNAAKKSDTTIELNNLKGLTIKDYILISEEISRIEKIDENNKITLPALKKDHISGEELHKLICADAGNESTTISSVEAGQDVIPIVSIDKIFNDGDYIKIRDECFYIKSANSNNIILLAEELKFEHKLNDVLEQLITAIEVQALNEGAWGNDIKIVVKKSSISKAKVMKAQQGKKILTLDTVAGMEKGTIIDITSGQDYVSVEEVIKDGNIIRLKENLPKELKEGAEISTVEFDLEVMFRGYSEYYRNLSMATEHSRYIEKVISDGSSGLITSLRVKDKMPERATQNILKPNDEGSGWPLKGGEDGIPEEDKDVNAMYIGNPSEKPEDRSGIYAMENENGISIVAIPGITYPEVLSKLINHCQLMKDRFAVIDSDHGVDLDGIKSQKYLYDSKFAALYYPWIRIFDPHPQSTGQINAPPSGHVCGVYARTDTERGVHKAPANEIVRGALDLEKTSSGFPRIITNGMQDILNPMGINCIRSFPGRGIRIWGARTISSDSLWKYINVRRLFIFLEKSIEQGTQWVVFEPNDEKLWSRVKQTIGQFLTGVWRSGALMGTTEEEAFFVKCDRTTMTQDDIGKGRLVVLVGVAPVKPAEFVIFRIAQVKDAANVSE